MTSTINTMTGNIAAEGITHRDADGDVDGSDFLVWQQHVGQGSFATASAANVPEPAGLPRAIAALTLAAGWRPCRHAQPELLAAVARRCARR